MKNTQKKDMTKGAILPHILRMAIPMSIGIGAIISFSLADTYFIGQLGATQLAAIGYTFPITALLFNAIFGMAIAMSSTVSRKIGAGLIDDVKKTVTIGILMVVLFSSILAIVAYVFFDNIFNAMGASGDVMPYIKEYISIWLISFVFLSIPVVANAAIRGMGDAFWPAIVMVIVAILNFILDPIFIFGLLGVPAMGIKGAAIASLIANIIAAITALLIITVREKIVTLVCVFSSMAWRSIAIPLLKIAIPVSLAGMIAPVISYGYITFLSNIGDWAVAGFGIATRIEAFALVPIMALAGGMSPLIGQNFGAKRHDRVNEALTKAIKFSLFYGAGCWIVLAIFAGSISNIFSTDTAVQEFLSSYLFYVPMSFIGVNIFAITTSTMNAMGRAKISLKLNLVKSFLIALPAAWILSNLYQVDGFIIAIILTNLTASVYALYYLRQLRCKL